MASAYQSAQANKSRRPQAANKPAHSITSSASASSLRSRRSCDAANAQLQQAYMLRVEIGARRHRIRAATPMHKINRLIVTLCSTSLANGACIEVTRAVPLTGSLLSPASAARPPRG